VAVRVRSARTTSVTVDDCVLVPDAEEFIHTPHRFQTYIPGRTARYSPKPYAVKELFTHVVFFFDPSGVVYMDLE